MTLKLHYKQYPISFSCFPGVYKSKYCFLFLFHTLSLGKLTHSHLSAAVYVLMAPMSLSPVLTFFLSSRPKLSIAH